MSGMWQCNDAVRGLLYLSELGLLKMTMNTVRNKVIYFALLSLPALFSGCSHNSTCKSYNWTLSAPGISVKIQGCPYGYKVLNASNEVVLSTLGEVSQNGYGALGYANGSVKWSNIVSQGYFSFTTQLDPWNDRWSFDSAALKGNTELDLVLKDTTNGRVAHIIHTVRESTLRVEVSLDGDKPRAWEASFSSPSDEAFLGFGERYNRTNQRGMDLYSWSEEGGLSYGENSIPGPANPFPNGETMTYYPVPFFISTKGYGFWLDSTWRNEFNLDSQRPDAWRVWHIGPSLAYEIYVPLQGDIRPWPYQLIDLFTKATGRPMIPPAWSFGPRRRIDPNSTVNGVPEVQAMRNLKLPITVVDDSVHILPHGSEIGQEATLTTWVQNMAQLGCYVIAYYNPYLTTNPASPVYPDTEKALQNGWLLKDASGKPITVWLISGQPQTVCTVDFTNPAATSWYQSLFNRALNIGYIGWMYDFGEYVQPQTLAYNGMSGEELHNLFPVLYQKAAYDYLENSSVKGQWYTFVRSGYTGSSQWSPMVWSGDPDASFGSAMGLPATVRAGINIGISGVANWGSDIGGFKCLAPDGSALADGELLTRWIEVGSMQSNMHDENACSGGTSPKATIWSSSDAQAAWKTYAALHTRLFPYFYTLAYQAHETGAPVIRQMFLENPDRPDLANVDDTYYLGPALLVAPVLKRGARSRDVILPSGWYLDWQDQILLSGGNTVTLNAPLGKLPLLLRDGYLIPMLDPSIDTLMNGVHPGVLGPDDIPQVYDVVGLLSTQTGQADFTFWDNSTLRATWSGRFSAPSFAQAITDTDLATCDQCWLADTISPNLVRVRITSAASDIVAGGLHLKANVNRKIRWDIYLVQ